MMISDNLTLNNVLMNSFNLTLNNVLMSGTHTIGFFNLSDLFWVSDSSNSGSLVGSMMAASMTNDSATAMMASIMNRSSDNIGMSDVVVGSSNNIVSTMAYDLAIMMISVLYDRSSHNISRFSDNIVVSLVVNGSSDHSWSRLVVSDFLMVVVRDDFRLVVNRSMVGDDS